MRSGFWLRLGSFRRVSIGVMQATEGEHNADQSVTPQRWSFRRGGCRNGLFDALVGPVIVDIGGRCPGTVRGSHVEGEKVVMRWG